MRLLHHLSINRPEANALRGGRLACYRRTYARRRDPLATFNRSKSSKILVVLAIFVSLVVGLASANADELIRSVQSKLSRLGYYKGKVDGSPGSVTSAAIRRYQLAQKLKVTGEVNQQTLAQLGLGATAPAPAFTGIGAFFEGGPMEKSESDKQVSTIRLCQKTLSSLGYFGGPSNGFPGPALAAAIQNWQRDNGLKPTGCFDAPTLKGLHLTPETQP